MDNSIAQDKVDEATFEFTLGNHDGAISLLKEVLADEPKFFSAWHALAEIYFDQRNLSEALDAGLKALAIQEDDLHLHTSLSRIYMESGDKEAAEKHGARARVLGWKIELKGENDA